jgi:hypothetical protein
MQPLRSFFSFFASARRQRRRFHCAPSFAQPLEHRCLLTAAFSLTDHEQLLLELVNRARSNPETEAARLGINLNDGLNPGELTSEPRPPLAPQQMLNQAAAGHAADMLARDYFSHTTLGTSKTSRNRAADQGYTGLVSENLSWGGSTSAINQNQHVYERHQALFTSPGHRRTLLRSTSNELGLSVQFGLFTSDRTYNASMVVQNYGTREAGPYITGVVYADTTDNNFYDIGEAIRSGTVSAVNLVTNQRLTTDIDNAGGFAIDVTPGEWAVEALYQYAGFDVRSVQLVQVASVNVKVDFERFSSGVVDPVLVRIDRSTLFEQGAENSATLTVSQTLPRNIPVTVQLATNAPDALRIPASVVIPAGQLAASVRIEGLPDDLIENPQQATVTAAVPGLSSSEATISVLDRTFPRLPATTQLVQTSRPLLSWSAIANAVSYEVWGDNTSSGQKRAAWAVHVPQNSWTPSADLALGNWNFYIRAQTADGRRSFWSPAGTWQVRPLPTVVGSGSTLFRSNAVLQWSSLDGAAAWDVWVDRIAPRISGIVRQSDIPANSFQLPELPLGRYWVYVRARNSRREYTRWSLPGVFTVTERISGIASIPAPFSSTLQLRWNPLEGAATYDVWVDDRTRSLSPAFTNYHLTNTSVSIPNVRDASLRVWIRARDVVGGLHAWSIPFDLAHQLPPSIVTPRGSASAPSAANPLKLSWLPVTSANSYKLQITDLAGQTVFEENQITSPGTQVAATINPGRYRLWLSAIDAAGTQRAAAPLEILLTKAHHAPPAEFLFAELLVPPLLSSPIPLPTASDAAPLPAAAAAPNAHSAKSPATPDCPHISASENALSSPSSPVYAEGDLDRVFIELAQATFGLPIATSDASQANKESVIMPMGQHIVTGWKPVAAPPGSP